MLKTFIRSWRDTFNFISASSPSASLVFYSEGGQYLTYFAPILDELKANDSFDIYYLTSDLNDPLLNNPPSRLKPYFIGTGSARTFLLNSLKASVVVMTMPDINAFHIKRSKNCHHYSYIHHSMVSMHMIYRKGAFDHFDSILCVGPHHIEEIRQWEKKFDLPPKQLLEHGYAPLDTILKQMASAQNNTKSDSAKLNILLAPSWGPQGLMETRSEEVVQILLEADYHVHVRPHPRTRQLAKECLEILEQKFNTHPDFNMDSDITQFEALIQSDIMISDWSGVALEYAFGLERPVLFIDVPRKINNPEYEEIDAIPLEVSCREKIGIILAPDQLDQLPSALKDLNNNKDRYRAQIRKFRDNNVYHLGESAITGARHILNLVESSSQANSPKI